MTEHGNDERLRFVQHKGHAIYLVDFSHCKAKEMLLLLEQIRMDVADQPLGSLLTLADFTGAEVDRNVVTRLKEVLTLDRPYVKRSAWVGSESLPHIFQEHIKSFSQRDFPAFKTREEAMDWLLGESLT